MTAIEATPEELQGSYSYTFKIEADVDASLGEDTDLFSVLYTVGNEAEDLQAAIQVAAAAEVDYCGKDTTVVAAHEQQDPVIFDRLVSEFRFVSGVSAVHAGGSDILVLAETTDPRAQSLIGEPVWPDGASARS